MTTRILTALACVAAVACSAPAQIAQYNFPGTSTGALFASSVASNVTATDINFTGSGASQYTPSPQRLRVTRAPGTTSASLAVTNQSYFGFELVPSSGFVLNLTSLTIDAATLAGNSGFVVRSSLDGFSTNLSSASVTTDATSSVYPTFTTDLSGSQFNSVAPIIRFRVYVWQSGDTIPSGASFFDNLTVNGTVVPAPVPEPTAVLGASAVALGAILRFRRQRQARTQ